MARKSDGTVYIDTKIDSQGFNRGIVSMGKSVSTIQNAFGKLGTTIKNAFSQVYTANTSKKYQELNNEIAKTEEKINKLIDKQNSNTSVGEIYDEIQKEIIKTEAELDKLIEKQKDNSSVIKAYDELQKEITRTEVKLDKLFEKQMRFVKIGGNRNSQTFKGMDYDIQVLANKLDELEQKLVSISSVPPDIIDKEIANDIEITKAKLEELRLKQEQVNQTASTQQTSNQFSILRKSIERVGNAAKSAAGKVLKLAGKGLMNGLKKLGSTLKNVAKNVISIDKSSKKANGSMLKMLSASILFSAVFKAISAATKGFGEGINNLVQYSNDANSTLSALKSSLTQLKNSFATAFMPIITVVTPVLTQFMSSVSKATSVIAAFFAALSGNKTYTKAIEVQEDYAASLDKTAESAKKTQKYLTGLDEIRTFSEEESDTGVVLPENMFTEEEIDSPILDFAEKVKSIIEEIKNIIKDEDWGGLGQYLASAVNTTLSFLYDALNWENAKEKIVPFFDGITGIFNNFVDNMDWSNLGSIIGAGLNTIVYSVNEFITSMDWGNLGTKLAEGFDGFVNKIDFVAIGENIGNGLNSIIDFLNEFINNIDWGSLGTKLAEGINELVSEVDWAKTGETLSDSIKGLLDLIINFLEEIDWQQIGNSIADFLGEIDWSGIVAKLFEGIGAALGGLTAFLWGLIEDAWKEVVQWWHDTAFEDGQFTITGLLDGIWESVKNIGKWLKEHIVNPFIEGFKKAFGINSPSTVMAELGGFIMEGLLNGIEEKYSKFKQTFENIKNTVVDIFDNTKIKVLAIWDNLVNGIKNAVNKVITVLNDMISGVISGINGMISALNGLSFDVPDWVPLIGGEKFGFNIPTVSVPKIPYLATGAVIPPNAPFMAILGDQRHGTNIEAPLDTIKQAVREVIGNGSGGSYRFTAQINRRTLFDEMITEAKLRQIYSGGNPFDLA